MAGYTRQSTGSIINGSPITAPPLNTEFNQLQSAFNATGGHTHTGGTGDAPKINLATSVTGFLPAANGGMGGQNKMDATTTPVVTNDNTEGFAPGSLWENTTTGRIYICVGSSTGAAVWRELLQVQNGNAVLPVATDTVDLGSNSVRFQDLFLSAGIAAAGNATIGGTLNITGATALGSTLGVTGDTTLVNLAATGTTTITSIDLNSGAIDSTTIGTTTPAAGTFTTLNANTSLVAATADINGGTVDGATIGASTPSTGAFTDLDASGTATLATVDINAGAIDGTVIGASSHTTGKFTTLQSTGQATLATVDINGGTIDGATVGATTASSGAFTTLTASGGITGALTGNVTGNVTGSLSGGTVTGNVTGNLTGNVTAGSGSSSFNDVTISGTLNMDANSAATITNLSAPTNDNDAARKIDVDNAVANLVDSAPDSLNTLNELAAALADDDDAFNTLNTSIGTKLPKAGGTMTGAIAMSTNKITGVGDPTAAQDVSSKAYTDAQRDTRLATAGGTMSGEVAMGNNKITGLATPVASTDASSKGYVDGVLGSATSASTSATTATTQAGIATTKAGEAANSASAAAGSATTASTALSTFQNQYLGAQGSAPTADPDGSALDVGDLYFDTTAGAMKVYSANGWTNAGSSVNGTTNRYSYTATAGQTVFAATYDAGYVDVFLNGVKQVIGSTKDVTATTGTSIVFNSATSVNDVVDIIGYGTFVLADHLTQAQSDARYVNLSGDTMTGNLDVQGTITSDGADVSGGADSTGQVVLSQGNATSKVSRIIGTNQGGTNERGIDFNTYYYADFKRMNISPTGDISFYDSTGTTPKMVWKSANERLGLGTDAPDKLVHLKTSVNNTAVLRIESTATDSYPYLSLKNDAREYQLTAHGPLGDVFTIYDGTAGSHRFVINSSGNVGIGVVPESWGTGNTVLQIGSAGKFGGSTNTSFVDMIANAYYDSANVRWEYVNSDFATRYMQIDGTHQWYTAASGTADAALTWSEAMRIDGGNLLVGKSLSAFNTAGIEARSGGTLWATADGTNAASFNRKTSDGAIAYFNKDGTTVGSIASRAGVVSTIILDPRSGQGAGITGAGAGGDTTRFMTPTDENGSEINGKVSLGNSANAFRDLYLSGGIQFDSRSSKLDDYEEGTWTATLSDASSGGNTTSTDTDALYTKIGNVVYFQCAFGGNVNVTGMTSSNDLFIQGLPFTSSGNNNSRFGNVDLRTVTYTAGNVPIGLMADNRTFLYFIETSTASGFNPLEVDQFSNGDSIYVSGHYFTNA